jgi:predicted mannosyl-3-phosphoglycerate phosphatase (HAD superfamily)
MTGTDAPLVIFANIDALLSSPAGAAASELTVFGALGDKAAIVLCSGRTRPEIEHLSQGLPARYPFICEHGAAAFVPDGYFPFEVPNSTPVSSYQVVEFGRSAAAVAELLRRTAARQGIRIRCFSDMAVEEVAQDCGMSLLDARLAKLRDYGELFRVDAPDQETRARLLDALRSAHLRCVPGPRFDHVGASIDVSVGVGMLRTLYRRLHGPPITVGVADWQADADVLQLVECPIVVESAHQPQSPRHSHRARPPRVVTVDAGTSWAASITRVIRELYPPVQTLAAD